MFDIFHLFAACSSGTIKFIPTWYQYLGSTTEAGKCSVVFNFPGDIAKVMLAIVDIMLRVGGIVAVAYVIYGGFQYIMSQGEPDKAKSGQHTITNALVGLVITMIATGIVNFVGTQLQK